MAFYIVSCCEFIKVRVLNSKLPVFFFVSLSVVSRSFVQYVLIIYAIAYFTFIKSLMNLFLSVAKSYFRDYKAIRNMAALVKQ